MATSGKVLERLIARKRIKLARLDDRIGAMMSQRAEEEEALASLLEKLMGTKPLGSSSTNPPVNGGQPFHGTQMVIVEKRKSDGRLDFTRPYAPSEPMTFDALYVLYFRESSGPGSWESLREWLESKSWVVRAKTW